MFRSGGSRKARLRWISAWISAAASLLPGIALAQASQCRIPARIDTAPDPRPAGEPVRRTAIRGYLLALSWSPQYCRRGTREAQCSGAAGRFGFVLHGLWPEGSGREYPQWCAPATPLSENIVRAQFCTTPSARLIAEDTPPPMARDAADYFAASRKLYASVRYPDMNALSRRNALDVGAFKRAFAAANPRLRPSGLIVTTDRDGDWLREVRVCLDATMRPEPCPRARGLGAPDRVPLRIWWQ